MLDPNDFLESTLSTTNEFGGEVIEYTAPSAEDFGNEIIEDSEQDATDDDNDANDSTDDTTDGDVADDQTDAETTEEEESDEESAEEGDEEAEPDSADEDDKESEKEPDTKPKKKVQNKVPVDRLNKEIAKRKALEAKVAALENAPAPEQNEDAPAPTPTITKEDFEKMQEAMLDGETDAAFELFQKMQAPAPAQSLSREEIAQEVRAELNAEKAVEELNSTATSIIESYPELNSQSDDADQGLIDEVLDYRNTYEQKGLTPAAALQKAVKMVAFENELTDKKAKPASITDSTRAKKKANITEKTKLASKERGKLGGESAHNKNSGIDINKLTDDQFGKLSPEAKARLRGDII
ncbi:MAG: hypothetical protein P8I94_06265 [Emcibacteraceae bacterium]|nr:hypothetical protein [Emcibacteraceae bacterium]